jgi:hypothetical protein
MIISKTYNMKSRKCAKQSNPSIYYILIKEILRNIDEIKCVYLFFHIFTVKKNNFHCNATYFPYFHWCLAGYFLRNSATIIISLELVIHSYMIKCFYIYTIFFFVEELVLLNSVFPSESFKGTTLKNCLKFGS